MWCLLVTMGWGSTKSKTISGPWLCELPSTDDPDIGDQNRGGQFRHIQVKFIVMPSFIKVYG
jgi:hypothetical protein